MMGDKITAENILAKLRLHPKEETPQVCLVAGMEIKRLREALNSFITAHSLLTIELATAKRDAERYRAALCNLLSVTGDCVVEVDDQVAYDDARDEAVEALNPKEDIDVHG